MIDLHLHLDGSMRPSTVRELLAEDGVNVWEDDKAAEEALIAAPDCSSLNDYLTKFDYPCRVLKKYANITRAVYELAEDIYHQGVTYAEIRFAPLLSCNENLSIEEAAYAAIEGAKKAEGDFQGIKLGIILCCMRGAGHSENMMTVEAAHKYLGNHVCAVDLAGAEGLYPTEDYEDVFGKAKGYDIPFTIHAGEAAGPESIWHALEFGAVRIGHGIRCIEDATLVDYLARHHIPLEVCPTSNMQTKVFGSMDEYPLKELLLNGVCATLNTDNMTVSNTTIAGERAFAIDRLDLTEDDITVMEQNSRKAAFLLDN